MTDAPEFVKALIEKTIVSEGGSKITNDPADRGGLTKWGITQTTWTAFRESAWPLSVADSSHEAAVEIYARRYWFAPCFDKVSWVNIPISQEMFDWGVTSGPSVPAKALQRALNVLNTQAADYPDITVDGNLGKMSQFALTSFANRRGLEGLRYLFEMVQSQRRVFYIEIAERNKTQERFENGWQSRIK